MQYLFNNQVEINSTGIAFVYLAKHCLPSHSYLRRTPVQNQAFSMGGKLWYTVTRIKLTREHYSNCKLQRVPGYWMVNRGPSFLAVWLLAHPPSLSSVSSTGDTQEDWERETTCWRERGRTKRQESLVLYKSFNPLRQTVTACLFMNECLFMACLCCVDGCQSGEGRRGRGWRSRGGWARSSYPSAHPPAAPPPATGLTRETKHFIWR